MAPGGVTTVVLGGGGLLLTLMQPATSKGTSSTNARIGRSSERDFPSIILPAPQVEMHASFARARWLEAGSPRPATLLLMLLHS